MAKLFYCKEVIAPRVFAEFHPDNIRDTLKAILQMSLVLTYSVSMPVVKVGRIAYNFLNLEVHQ